MKELVIPNLVMHNLGMIEHIGEGAIGYEFDHSSL